MNTERDLHTLNLLKLTHLDILDKNWCRKHPAYRATRQPKTDCPECQRLWEHRVRLNQIEDLIESIIETEYKIED